MKLSDLNKGQVVNVRYGRAGQYAPSWCAWHPAEIEHLVRRVTPLPKRFHNRSNAPNAGDIITIVVSGWAAEYAQGDYQGNGCFVNEDYYLEIEGLE